MANVRKMLDLSSGHLTVATRDLLDEWGTNIDHLANGCSAAPFFLGITDFGWMMGIPDPDQLVNMPADLVACVAHARANDCTYILFDADAEDDEALPYYDEEEPAT